MEESGQVEFLGRNDKRRFTRITRITRQIAEEGKIGVLSKFKLISCFFAAVIRCLEKLHAGCIIEQRER